MLTTERRADFGGITFGLVVMLFHVVKEAVLPRLRGIPALPPSSQGVQPHAGVLFWAKLVVKCSRPNALTSCG